MLKYREWTLFGKLHRTNDLPAKVYDNGRTEWLINDKYHRDGDLPARIEANGTQSWWQHDGPAIIFLSGGKSWFRRGKCLKTETATIKTT